MARENHHSIYGQKRTEVSAYIIAVKHLEGEIWEIRSQFANNIQRACYFHAERDHYIITHGFTKKTQKTPRSEIRKAQTFYKLYKQEG